jgi:hypothetical protein
MRLLREFQDGGGEHKEEHHLLADGANGDANGRPQWEGRTAQESVLGWRGGPHHLLGLLDRRADKWGKGMAAYVHGDRALGIVSLRRGFQGVGRGLDQLRTVTVVLGRGVELDKPEVQGGSCVCGVGGKVRSGGSKGVRAGKAGREGREGGEGGCKLRYMTK